MSIVSKLASQGRDVWKALMNILVRFAQIPMLMTNAIDVFSKLGKFHPPKKAKQKSLSMDGFLLSNYHNN